MSKRVPPSLGPHLFMHLCVDQELIELVGDRIYKGRDEQDVQPPSVVYFIEVNDGEYDLDGHTGDWEAEVRFNIVAQNDDEGIAISAAICNRLIGHTGTVANVEITECSFISDTEEEPEETIDLYHRILTLLISFKRADAN